MKLIVVLSLLYSVASVQALQPLDFNQTKLKGVWESPDHQPALKKLNPKLAPEEQRSGRIIGGSQATPYQFPYHVFLLMGYSRCGGSLIKFNWVLTVKVYLQFKKMLLFEIKIRRLTVWKNTPL